MFSPVWNYLKGYVIIKASGLSAGKFINMTSYYGINLWDIKNDGKAYYIKADIKDADELKELSRKSGCRTEIIKYKGLPVLYRKIRKRKAYALGAFIFAFMLYFLSGFVWTVNVEGNYRVTSNEIKNFCRQNGIYPGVLKKNIDQRKAAEMIIAEFEDISWASVSIKGTEVLVSIAETIPETEIIDNSYTCDIISDIDGIIENITVISGTPMVRAGDVVKKGDVLVSGRLEIKDGDELKGERYVKAEAYIRAQTVHKIILQVNLNEKIKQYTGRSTKIIETEFFGVKKEFGLDTGYNNYDKELFSEISLKIGDYKAPFSLKVYNIKEYETVQKRISEEEASQKARDYLEEKEEELFGLESYVINENITNSAEKDSIIYTAVLTVSQKIGAENPVDYNNDTLRGENN